LKIKIVSNGTPEGTKVFDDQGRQLPLAILRIKWECSVNKPAIAELLVADVEVQVTGEVASLGNKSSREEWPRNRDIHEDRFGEPIG
jgi:hypothetical protein